MIYLADLYLEINRMRFHKGIPVCFRDQFLERAASRHCEDMFVKGFVSHIGSDGSTFITRVRDANRPHDPSGEIICKGPGGANAIENVVKAWMESPGHREIMLDPKQRFFGGSFRKKDETIKGNYWVVVFAYE